VGGGLVGRVGDDPDVGFAGEEGFAEGVGQRGDGGLGSAAGSEDVEFCVAFGGHSVEVAGHPLVHGGRRFEEVVGEVGFAPKQEVRVQGSGVKGSC